MTAEILSATQELNGAARGPDDFLDIVDAPPVDDSGDVTGASKQYDIDDDEDEEDEDEE